VRLTGVEIHLIEVGCEGADWIHLAEDGIQWRSGGLL
jgi:hypothetical protein